MKRDGTRERYSLLKSCFASSFSFSLSLFSIRSKLRPLGVASIAHTMCQIIHDLYILNYMRAHTKSFPFPPLGMLLLFFSMVWLARSDTRCATSLRQNTLQTIRISILQHARIYKKKTFAFGIFYCFYKSGTSQHFYRFFIHKKFINDYGSRHSDELLIMQLYLN